ncbi:C-type lectin BfL-1 [Trachinotus anak]|uniref:C-type lectin BfL-1 n=1 Tax=Trachinotus anak TaxID=443729 RepID=UPI0039F21BA8
MCYKGNNYTLIENKKKNWCQAQLYCRRYFTDLVSISNETQNQQVIDKGKNKTFWIGLMHDEWEWEDNSCSTYRDWHSPKSVDSCTHLKYDKPFLSGRECDVKAIAICSKGHVRIKVINQSLTWEEAFQYCEVNHTGLLQIEDEQDQDAVKQWLSYAGVNGSFWIGLRQSRVFGFWIWRNRTVTYSNWRNGRQPEMPMSNHCGAISNTDYKWSDENCWLQLPFLCEEEISFMKK